MPTAPPSAPADVCPYCAWNGPATMLAMPTRDTADAMSFATCNTSSGHDAKPCVNVTATPRNLLDQQPRTMPVSDHSGSMTATPSFVTDATPVTFKLGSMSALEPGPSSVTVSVADGAMCHPQNARTAAHAADQASRSTPSGGS